MIRIAVLAVLASMGATAVQAQPIVATPLPPLDDRPETPQQPPAPKPLAPVWLPQGSAIVQVLDKVNAQNQTLTVKAGQSARFGSMTILVKSCVIRPPDKPSDAAAFLVVTDSRDEAAAFSGWIVRSAPAVSMLQHPIYDLRVTGCTP